MWNGGEEIDLIGGGWRQRNSEFEGAGWLCEVSRIDEFQCTLMWKSLFNDDSATIYVLSLCKCAVPCSVLGSSGRLYIMNSMTDITHQSINLA